MTKGREAVRAARRRQAEAGSEAARLKAEMAGEREAHRIEVADLRAQITELRADVWHKASEMSVELTRDRLEEIEKARRAQGLSDDITVWLCWQKDRLIRNACKYISMTSGTDPYTAIAMVLTWCTDKDIRSLLRDDMEWFIELGVPPDGWVAGRIKRDKRWQKTEQTRSSAVSLDHAIEQDHPKIHPDYKKYGAKWYPSVNYPEHPTAGPAPRGKPGVFAQISKADRVHFGAS
jgi:hypothetical protein